MPRTLLRDLEDAAKAAAGNHRKFECFCWYDEPADGENWALIYTHNRDSGLLDQSNASQIEEALRAHSEGDDPDVVFETHSHWACGSVFGARLRVFNPDGSITDAFRVYHDLLVAMDEYPVLSDEHYSQLEYDATLENINDAAWRVKRDYLDLPDGWEERVFGWLWNSVEYQGDVASRDDRGGYPSEEALRAAFDALGFEKEADDALVVG